MKKELSVPEKHQRMIALKTLTMHEAGASIMGGMNHRQAVEVLRNLGMDNLAIKSRLMAAGHDAAAIARFMNS